MSRPTISNHKQLDRWVERLQITSKAAAHRSLIIIQNPAEGWLEVYADATDACYFSAHRKQDRADTVTALLGTEHSKLVYETRQAIDAGILAALAGTLKAGGTLVLGLPFDIEGHDNSLSPFAQRFGWLARQLQNDHPENLAVLNFTDSSDISDAQQQVVLPEPDTAIRPHTSLSSVVALAQAEQDRLLSDALSYLDQHPHGCIIITGKRGRGKSMLLARLATLVQKKHRQLHITSAHRSALSTLRRQAPELDSLFIAPENLARDGAAADNSLLLVDEAASLPLALLATLIEQHRQVVLCTTVEGYETTGRAFDIRFIDQLKSRFIQLLELQPLLPWRWADDDPLELFIDRLMLTGSARTKAAESGSALALTVTENSRETSDHIQTQVRQLDRLALAQEEPLLASVYTLLHEYHYQTSALDLTHMLDAPDLQIWIAEQQANQHDSCVVGAVLLCLEGKIEPELHEPITSKQRRLSHQLLPQLLAQSANRSAALSERYARVIRVSVKPECRRQGVATQLLSSIQNTLGTAHAPVDTMGASFADDECTVRFWLANGFTPFHRGFRSNPRTGTHAMAVIRSSNNNVNASIERASLVHADNEQWRTVNRACMNTAQTSEHLDAELLQRFANTQRSAHDTAAALGRLLKAHGLETVLDADPASTGNQSLNVNITGASRRIREGSLRKRIASLL